MASVPDIAKLVTVGTRLLVTETGTLLPVTSCVVGTDVAIAPAVENTRLVTDDIKLSLSGGTRRLPEDIRTADDITEPAGEDTKLVVDGTKLSVTRVATMLLEGIGVSVDITASAVDNARLVTDDITLGESKGDTERAEDDNMSCNEALASTEVREATSDGLTVTWITDAEFRATEETDCKTDTPELATDETTGTGLEPSRTNDD